MIKHVMRLVLAMSAASLLFACGGEQQIEVQPAPQAQARSLSQAVQCSDVATIAAGEKHTVGLKSDGTVTAVGDNYYGQRDVSTWTNIKAIAAGTFHTVGLKSDGTVTAVGDWRYGQLDVSPWTNIKAIAARTYHTVGLKSDGTVTAVGLSAQGQTNVSTWTNIEAVAAGEYHTVGLKSDGTVTAVGPNGIGQRDVSTWTNIKAIAAGAYHTVGLKSDGTVTAVGFDYYGQRNVSTWTNIKAIAAGANHTVGLKEDGTVVAVGDPSLGRLDVSTWTNIKAIAAGTYHTVGLKEDGTVVAVGDPSFGRTNVSTLTNIMPICGAIQDVTPPITTNMMTGTLGNNGWYKSDVQMTLTATDNNGGSGVKEIHYTVDGTETVAQGSSASHSIIGDGTHAVTWYAIDTAGNVETPAHEMSINIDKTPPLIPSITTNMMTGTLGNNGWYKSDVQMTLTATDNNGGSGVKEIHYTVDGTETVVQGSSASDSIVGDGTHAVTWYAIDTAGNVETPVQTMSINIDKTPPSIPSLSAAPSILWPPNHKMMDVLIGGSAPTDGGSGIASTIITVTDEYGIYNMTVPGFGSAIPLESWRTGNDMDGRRYTITAVATDKAGNRSTRTTTVLVPHDKK